MIRICTIHHETDKFLKIQLDHIEKYTRQDYKIYAGVYNISHLENSERCDHIDMLPNTTPANRLNHLFQVLSQEANSGDMVIFMDSDCFPISENWINELTDGLSKYPIAAIQRSENFDASSHTRELFPHCCFFCTSFDFWESNNLYHEDNIKCCGWSIGEWLIQHNLDFYKLIRSNSVNIHPLMFGVYNNIIYHHGAGNRLPYDGIDVYLRLGLETGTALDLMYPQILMFNQKLSDIVYEEIKSNYSFIRNYLLGIK